MSSATSSAATDARSSPRYRWPLPEPSATVAFGALLVLAFVLILIETRGLSFFADEWDFLLDRRGISAKVLLSPHGPHLSLVPILIYKVLLAVFGSSSYLPFRCLTALDLVGLAGVVGLIARRAWGPWWGLIPVVLLIALGPGYTTVLSPFQVGYALALIGGLLSFVFLSRQTLTGDLLAGASLLVSLASSSQGVGFLVGAAVYLVLRGGSQPRHWLARAWVIVIPAVLYGLWYLHYGRQNSQTDLSLWNTAFVYTINGISSTFAGLLALTTVGSTGLLDETLGVPIVLAAAIGLFAAGARGWRPAPLFWAAATTMLLLWFLAAVSDTPSVPRYFNDPRYLSSNSSILLVLACAVVPRPRLAQAATVFVALLAGVVAVTNISQYGPGRASLSASMVYTRAETGALLVMRGVVSNSFDPSFAGDPGVVPNVVAGPFFSAYDKFGTFDSDDTRALKTAPEAVREVVDQELQRGENIGLNAGEHSLNAADTAPRVLFGAHRTSGGCVVSTGTALIFQGSPGEYLITAPKHSSAAPAMARFAAQNSVSLGTLGAGTSATVTLPADHVSGLPWRVDVPGIGARVCEAAS